MKIVESDVAEVLDLKERQRRLAARKGFEGWINRFSEPFDENTRLGDLSDDTLRALIQAGPDASMPLYELILGVKGLGKGPRFYYLENEDKMLVMDVALFLLDQLRFEAMRRLGWVGDYPTFHVPLVSLVMDFSARYSAVQHSTPSLSPNHPRFEEFEKSFVGDRGAFVRKLIPEAIEGFNNPDRTDADP